MSIAPPAITGVQPQGRIYFYRGGPSVDIGTGGTGARTALEARKNLGAAPRAARFVLLDAHPELQDTSQDLSALVDGILTVATDVGTGFATIASTVALSGISLTILDNALTVQDNGDPTKQFRFQASGISTATMRTYTVPDADTVLAGLSVAQDWTAPQVFGGPWSEPLTCGDAINGGTFIIYQSSIGGPMLWFRGSPLGVGDHVLFNTFGGPGEIEHYLPIATQGTFLAVDNNTGAMPTAGRLLYGAGATSPMTTLAIGSAGNILTVNAGATAPQWSTNAAVVDIARTWATLQTFKDTTFKVVDDSDSSKTIVFSAGGASANADLTLAWAGTGDRTFTFPDITGTALVTAGDQSFTGVKTALLDTGGLFAATTATPAAMAFFSVKDSATGFGVDLVFSGAISADQTVTFPSGGGTLAHRQTLTATRVLFAGSSNIISSDADMTFATDTLTVTKIVVGGGASTARLDHGVYTPTLTNVTNVAASTAYECQWMRVGNTVSVSGKVAVDPTAAGATELGISLPAASNFGAEEDCGGTAFAAAIAGQGAAIRADAANDRAAMVWIAVDITNQPMHFQFQYQVI